MPRPLTREIARRFARERERECDAAALIYHALLLGAFALLCAGLLPAAAFMVVGFCLYIRNFNALHESSHARPDPESPLRPLRQLAMIVHGPIQLGRDGLAGNHRLHHAHPGDPRRDPDAPVNRGTCFQAAVHAFIQPEETFVARLRRSRDPGVFARAVAYNVAVSALLVALAGGDIVWWIAVTRLGSTACWFVFDWVLHHPRVWEEGASAWLPRPARALWALMFSTSNLQATRFHKLHHVYPFVADRDLPALAAFLTERRAGVGE